MSKTFKVEEFKQYINKVLKSDKISQEKKQGYCGAIEFVLLGSDNYNGFQYTYWAEKGYKEWQVAGEPGFPEKNKYIGNEYDRQYY